MNEKKATKPKRSKAGAKNFATKRKSTTTLAPRMRMDDSI